MTDEALFDWHVPIRKDARNPEYLGKIAGTFGGYPLWELAPTDRYVRENTPAAQPASDVDFVWLIVNGRPTWALVNIYTHDLLALDPAPIERSAREALNR